MSDRRLERQRAQQRTQLLRALDHAESGSLYSLPDEASTSTRELSSDPWAPFFHDHEAMVQGFDEMLRRAGLVEALLALARHQEDDRDVWMRRHRLRLQQPGLRARQTERDDDYLQVLRAHFQTWGAATLHGERSARFEAAATLSVLRCAEDLWAEQGGRPTLPILVQEGLALLWPALYPHQKR